MLNCITTVNQPFKCAIFVIHWSAQNLEKGIKHKKMGAEEREEDQKLLTWPHVVPSATPPPWHWPLSYVSHLEHPCWHPSVLIILGSGKIIARGKITLKILPSWSKCPSSPRAFIISFKGLWKWGRSHFHSYAKHSIMLMSESIQGRVLIKIIWKPIVCQTPSNKGFLKLRSSRILCFIEENEI